MWNHIDDRNIFISCYSTIMYVIIKYFVELATSTSSSISITAQQTMCSMIYINNNQ